MTRKIALIASSILKEGGEQIALLDLAELPLELFSPSSYATKPAGFEAYQEAVLTAEGILTVTPEYNGSYPGALKYFIDMLRFPESLVDKPAGFVGLSSGRWGALRSVEQLAMVFQYRCAHLYGRRVFLPGVHELIDDEGRIQDPEISDRLREMVTGFSGFCRQIKGNKG
jgi:NAD(P)H-dependent FMN reductase